jgi:hypothetical protein
MAEIYSALFSDNRSIVSACKTGGAGVKYAATFIWRTMRKRVSKSGTCLVVSALMLVLFSLDAPACQVDEFYLTKGGSLAAASAE